MRGLLADANAQGHANYLHRLLKGMGLWSVLSELEVEFATFADLGVPQDIDDAALWSHCQADGWVLFTDNRNEDDETSLEVAMLRYWKPGDLPVLTLADKAKFEQMADYRERVAADIADLLFGIVDGEFRDCARIYVPR